MRQNSECETENILKELLLKTQYDKAPVFPGTNEYHKCKWPR